MRKITILILAVLIVFACNLKPNSNNKSESNTVSDTLVDRAKKILEKENVEYAYPHWSKDGKSILFQSNQTGNWHIYIMNEDGSNIRQITTDSSNNNFIDWSPDNKKICFVSDRTGNEEIFVMDSSGENQTQLTFNNARDIHPYWSPDGSKIFFNSTRADSSNFEIFEMDSLGRNIKRITYTEDNETCARLSPAGNNLIYLRNNDKGFDEVFLKNLSDSVEKRITFTESRDGWPCWFPDGKKFIFSTKENDVYKLFIYDLSENTMQKISNPPDPYWDGRANISADGKKIVFNRQKSSNKNTIGIYLLYLELIKNE
jgi:TolB protein